MARKKAVVPAHILHDSCCNCRFWRRLDDSEQIPEADVIGECRRYPPTVCGPDEIEFRGKVHRIEPERAAA